ncbi:hypothetical protein PSE_2378 [Pseudovibrio sp. FO-BEG1]|nr:hypothetical protein PSE_2378 [Pseudovibrio sp. FO-BEG1]
MCLRNASPSLNFFRKAWLPCKLCDHSGKFSGHDPFIA